MKRLPGDVLLVICTAIFCLATGCKRPIEHEAEKRVKAVLPQYVGPADRYDVTIQGDSSGAVMRGHLKSVHIAGQKVQLDQGLVLDRLTLDFEEVSVNTKEQRLENIGQAAFECRIHSPILNDYVRRQHPEIADLKISLRADTLFIAARPDALGLVEKPLNINLPGKLGVPIEVEGKLIPVGGSKLDFAPDKASVSIVPVPRFALDFFAGKLNPVVNLSTLRIPIQANRTFVRGEYLYLSGTIRPDDIMKLQQKD